MLFTAPQTAPATTLPGIIRPQHPHSGQSDEDDYDAAYLDARADDIVGQEADLPLFSPVEKVTKVVTSSELLARCSQFLSKADVERVRQAFMYADDAHLGQFRKSGEPYITHPLAVANILAEWRLDSTTICAGLMHDVLEDTPVAKIEMVERFGVEVAELVDGVSKLDKLRFSSNEIAQAESFRKMLLAMSRDVRVIFVKLADRLHNLRTLGVMRPDKRRRIAKETLEIYVPIAHRLGLNTVFRELQELSFFNHYPRRYEILRENVILTRGNRKAVLERILRETRSALPKCGIVAQVQGRDKTIYGIYNRMRDTHASFSDVLDIYGFRVIVRTREECYLTLCALHQLYKPVHNRFKDFIAIPKANGYRSLHTTVIGPYGTPVEYQIRTEEMHRIDEMGILSHWIYNDSMDTSGIQNMVKSWLQSLMEIQRTSADSSEFLENIKIDTISVDTIKNIPYLLKPEANAGGAYYISLNEMLNAQSKSYLNFADNKFNNSATNYTGIHGLGCGETRGYRDSLYTYDLCVAQKIAAARADKDGQTSEWETTLCDSLNRVGIEQAVKDGTITQDEVITAVED